MKNRNLEHEFALKYSKPYTWIGVILGLVICFPSIKEAWYLMEDSPGCCAVITGGVLGITIITPIIVFGIISFIIGYIIGRIQYNRKK